MAKDISISIASETRAFQKGVKDGIIEPLDGAIESIEDLGKAGDDTGEQLTDSMKDAQKKTELLGDEYTDLKKKIDDVGKQSKDSFKGMRDASDKAGEGVSELKDEAKSTAKEAAASFDGSAESIVDAFQEVSANAFAGFGPAGMVAGLAVAAGIGIATQAFQANEEQSKEAAQAISDFGLAIIESGQASAEIDFVNANIKKIITNADGAGKKLKDIERLVSIYPSMAGDVGLLTQAYAGNKDAIDLVIGKMKEEMVYRDRRLGRTTEQIMADQSMIEGLNVEVSILEKIKTGVETAAAVEKGWIESGGEARQARKSEMDAINQAYDDAAGNVTDFVNKETGLFDTKAYIESMQRRETALKDYQSALATSGLSDEAKRFLNEQGAEAAATMLSGYASGDQATKDELNRIWTEAGKDASGAAQDEIKNTFKTPQEAKVEVNIDTAKAQENLDRFIANRKIQLQIELTDRNGKTVP